MARSSRRFLASMGVCLLMMSGLPAIAGTDDAHQIARALTASAAAWSKGDLTAFMDVYENAPDTVYIGSAGPVRGYEAIKAMYAARFAGKPGAMGQLSLDILDDRPLGRDFALVTGRFTLRRAGHDAGGIFTLVFHKSAAGWGIVSDHTS